MRPVEKTRREVQPRTPRRSTHSGILFGGPANPLGSRGFASPNYSGFARSKDPTTTRFHSMLRREASDQRPFARIDNAFWPTHRPEIDSRSSISVVRPFAGTRSASSIISSARFLYCLPIMSAEFLAVRTWKSGVRLPRRPSEHSSSGWRARCRAIFHSHRSGTETRCARCLTPVDA
jgi:hypothetical protein